MLHGSPRVSDILHSTVSIQSTVNLIIPRIIVASGYCGKQGVFAKWKTTESYLTNTLHLFMISEPDHISKDTVTYFGVEVAKAKTAKKTNNIKLLLHMM